MNAVLAAVAYVTLAGPLLVALVWRRLPASQRIYVRRGH